MSDSIDHVTYTGPIIFPTEGNWIDYLTSLRGLLDTVHRHNDQTDGNGIKLNRVKVSCGHTTTGADAEDVIVEVLVFFERILRDKVEIIDWTVIRGEVNLTWRGRVRGRGMGRGREWAVRAPIRLYDQAKVRHESDEQRIEGSKRVEAGV